MEKVQEAFSRPALVKLPAPDQLALLNDRRLTLASFQVGTAKFPQTTSRIAGIQVWHQRGLEAALVDQAIVIKDGKRQALTLHPQQLVVFLQRVNAQNIVPTLPDQPMYKTIVYLADAAYRLYLSVFGSRLGYFLATNDVGIPVVDLLHLGQLELTGDEYQFASAVTTQYSALVKGTAVDFLDTQKPTLLKFEE